MANKKKKSSPSSSPARSLTFTAELYPEWSNYINILTYLQKYKYAYIEHKFDVKEDTGEIKKPHAHVVIKYGGRRTLSVVKNEFKMLGVPNNLVNTCNERAMLRYLLHLDNPEKHQYSKDEVKTNMPNECQSAWNDEVTSEEGFRLLNDYIESSDKIITQAQLNRYAITKGLTKGLRSFGSHINGARIEHNRYIDELTREEVLIDQTKVRIHQAIRQGEEKAKSMINEWVDDVEVTGIKYVEYGGKKYAIQSLGESSHHPIIDETDEQIDMLKQSRLK